MKARLLSILRQAEGPVSGESMGARLGVSRVAVFKQISRLRDMGYDIAATGGGYRLRREPDTPFPWAFPGREDRMLYFPETVSTMDCAKKMAREGCPPFTVVTADRQTRGRGRLDRVWESNPGGLYFTVVTRPRLTPDRCHRVLFVASWVLARLLVETYGIDARLKWPNDIRVNGKKLAGMLSEMEAETDRVLFVNVGMGINVNNEVATVAPPATSMKALLGAPVSRRDLLARFLDAFEDRHDKGDFPEVLSSWKQLTDTLHRPVRIVTFHETIEGIALDLDDEGALLVRRKDGKIQRIVYGDCFHA